MGFLSQLLSATVKTALTPIAVLKDAVNVATGKEPDATKTLLESAGEDVVNSVEDLSDGEVL